MWAGAQFWILWPIGLIATLYLFAYVAAVRAARALVPIHSRALQEPLVVIVPARDEEERLAPTLSALLADRHPALRVLVYDDRSSDQTRSLAERFAASDPRLCVVTGHGDPAATRFGKPAALAQAVAVLEQRGLSQARQVLFLDADVVLEPGALGGLVDAFHRSGAAALSGVPRLQTHGFWESLLVPAFVSLAARRFPPGKVHDTTSPIAFLNGQLILIDRDVLAEVGGFEAVSDAILEDVALAQRMKSAGHTLRLADLRGVAHTRMYTALPDIVAGYGKNAVPLQGGALPAAAVALLGLVLGLAPPLCLVGAAALRNTPLVCGTLSAFVVVVLCQMGIRHVLRVPRWPAWFSALAAGITSYVLLRAAWRVSRRKTVVWRDRRYLATRR